MGKTSAAGRSVRTNLNGRGHLVARLDRHGDAGSPGLSRRSARQHHRARAARGTLPRACSSRKSDLERQRAELHGRRRIMGRNRSWSEWWRGFLGIGSDGYRKALEILCTRYLEENQHVARYRAQAEKLQYPQFRIKLSAIAADETKHVNW